MQQHGEVKGKHDFVTSHLAGSWGLSLLQTAYVTQGCDFCLPLPCHQALRDTEAPGTGSACRLPFFWVSPCSKAEDRLLQKGMQSSTKILATPCYLMVFVWVWSMQQSVQVTWQCPIHQHSPHLHADRTHWCVWACLSFPLLPFQQASRDPNSCAGLAGHGQGHGSGTMEQRAGEMLAAHGIQGCGQPVFIHAHPLLLHIEPVCLGS